MICGDMIDDFTTSFFVAARPISRGFNGGNGRLDGSQAANLSITVKIAVATTTWRAVEIFTFGRFVSSTILGLPAREQSKTFNENRLSNETAAERMLRLRILPRHNCECCIAAR